MSCDLDEEKNGHVATSERPITVCTIVKGWTCQGSLIWHQHEVMREQGPIRTLVSFTPQRNMQGNFWAIHLGWPVQVDRLVSYPLVFIYLRL